MSSRRGHRGQRHRLGARRGTKGWLEDVLVESAVVSGFVGVADALPGNALGFVPSDFDAALNILEDRPRVGLLAMNGVSLINSPVLVLNQNYSR